MTQEINYENKLTHYKMGWDLYYKGKIQEALDEFEKSAAYLSDTNEDLTHRFNLAKIFLSNFKQFQKAEKLLLKAIDIDPTNDLSYFLYGLIFFIQNKFTPAVEYFLKALEINPQNPETHNYLGLLYYSLNVYDKSKISLEQAVALKSGNEQVYEYLYKIYDKLNEKEAQAQLLKTLESTNKDLSIKVRESLGIHVTKYLVHTQSSNDKMSDLFALERSHVDLLKQIEYLENHAHSHFEQRHFVKAEEYALEAFKLVTDQILEQTPSNNLQNKHISLGLLLGSLFRINNKVKDASSLYNEMVGLYTEEPALIINYAKILTELGQLSYAEKLLNYAFSITDGTKNMYDNQKFLFYINLGAVFEQQGRIEKAERAYITAYNLGDDNNVLLFAKISTLQTALGTHTFDSQHLMFLFIDFLFPSSANDDISNHILFLINPNKYYLHTPSFDVVESSNNFELYMLHKEINLAADNEGFVYFDE